MNVKTCCSRQWSHLVFYYRQNIVHHSAMLMPFQTTYIFLHENWCTALAYFLRGLIQGFPAFLHGWNTKIIVHIPCNPHIWKGYRLQKFNFSECISITAKIISRKCTHKELLCESAFLVRKKIEALLLYCFVSCNSFFPNIKMSYEKQNLHKHQNEPHN